MAIIKTSYNENEKREIVKCMGMGQRQIKNEAGTKIDVAGYVIYTTLDNATGEEKEIISIAGKDGNVFASLSPTVIRSFLDLIEVLGDSGFSVIVKTAKSNSNRDFFYLELEWLAMDLTRIKKLIEDNANENAEILSDLETLETQNSEYDTNYNVYKNGVDNLTESLTKSRAENQRLLSIINGTNIGKNGTSKKDNEFQYSVDIFKH